MLTSPHACGLLAPAHPPSGTVSAAARVPSSKSEAIRAILLAARANWMPDPPLSIGPLPEAELGEDVASALGVAVALGAGVERSGERVLVQPRPSDYCRADLVELDVGESATLARFATAIAALDPHCVETRIAGRGTLARRRSPALFAALALQSADLEFEADVDGWPVRVHRVDLAVLGSLRLDDPCSSQELSALLLAGGGPDGRHRGVLVNGAIPSRPYLDLTMRVMGRFGMYVSEVRDLGTDIADVGFGVRPAVPEGGPIDLEPDASLASVVLAAACLGGGELRVPGLGPDSAQGDVRIARHLTAFGCDAALEADGLRAGGRPTRGAEVDLAGEPDLAPVVAAVAADAALRLGAESRLSGLGTLAGKESDRFAGIVAALGAIGLHVVPAGREELWIGPAQGTSQAPSLVLDAQGDHRMAYLHALLGLVVPGVMTRDGRCVAKTWRAFWRSMAALGFEVVGDA